MVKVDEHFYLTTGEAARILHVSRVWVWYLVKAGKLPAPWTVGRMFLIDADAVTAMAEKRKVWGRIPKVYRPR